jgi:hypothetical protein
MFTGKFTATFIGSSAFALSQSISNKSIAFGVKEFNNIICTESSRITEVEMNQIIQNQQSMRIESNLNTGSVAFPLLDGIERHQIDWESFRFYNPVFSSLHHTNRGFNFPFLRNFTLLDAALTLVINTLLFIPRLFKPKLLSEYSSEIFVGYIEADFVCRVLRP